MKRFRKILFFGVLITFLFGFAYNTLALEWPNSPVGTALKPTCTKEELKAGCKPTDLTKAIKYFYEWAIPLGGLAAFIMLLVAGFQYLTSTGDPTKTKDARDRIGSAIGGLVLLLASFLLFNIINPELTTLRIQPLDLTKGPEFTVGSGSKLSKFGVPPCEKVLVYAKENFDSSSLIKEFKPGEITTENTLSPKLGDTNRNLPGSLKFEGSCIALLYPTSDGSGDPAKFSFDEPNVSLVNPEGFGFIKVISTPQPGSSGAPAAGQQAQCRGPGSYADSTRTSLEDAAKAICDDNKNKTPLDADIHFFLASGAGSKGCTAEDVTSVRDLLLKSCGKAPGEVVGAIRIDQETVPARICSYTAPLVGASGFIYNSSVVPNKLTYVSSGREKPPQLLLQIQSNTAAFVQHCSEQKSKGYCFLQDRSTQIGSFDNQQKAALAQFCYDILP